MTPQEIKKRAIHVLGTQGKAPVVVRSMSDALLAKLSDMIEPGGALVAGVHEKVRLVLVEHAESFKATDAANEGPDVAAQQKVRDEAAKLVAGGDIEVVPAWSNEDEQKYKENTQP